MRAAWALGATVLLVLPPVPASAGRLRLTCHDGQRSVARPDVACDVDEASDGVCSVGLRCLPCVWARPPCQAPCRETPDLVGARLEVGERRLVRVGERTRAVVRCRRPRKAAAACRRTGCSSHVCADRPVMTTCEYRPEYACYDDARCERQPDGGCGWTMTEELAACLREAARPP